MKPILPVVFAFLIAPAAPAAGQNLPGYQGDYDTAEAQFRAYALEEMQKVLTAWTEAALDKDVDAAMGHYAPNAFVYLDGVARGTEQVRERLTSWLDGVDDFRIGLSDFDASGSMSYASVSIVINAVNPDDDADGTLVFVLHRQGRNWRIRSQTLVLN